MARGIAFINESSAVVWMWANEGSNEFAESTFTIGENGHLESVDGDVLDVNLTSYAEVVDGLRPASSPVGRGIIGGTSYTIWVRTDKSTGAIVDWSHLTIAPTQQRNGLLNRVK